MDDGFEEDVEFKATQDADETQALILDIDGWEGPLHLLLALARKNKVDLAKISILELADQYLSFIHEARKSRLDVAADYLVMAAWLAYLKSRLLLPKPRPLDDEPEPEDLAQALAFRLLRLEAMRTAAKSLYRGQLKGRDVFTAGNPEGVRAITTPHYQAQLFDLMKAYGEAREREVFSTYSPPKPKVYSLEEARERFKGLVAKLAQWQSFDTLLPEDSVMPKASVQASSLLAALELAKEGDLKVRQDETYGPIWMKSGEYVDA